MHLIRSLRGISTADGVNWLHKFRRGSDSLSRLSIVAKDLLQRGDQVVSTFEGKTGRQVKMSVETSTGKCPVTVVATYQILPSGLTTFAQAEITALARGLKITLNMTNYQQQ